MEQQALTFTLQQGVAVAVCVAVALAFGYALVKLFRTAKEERDQATARYDAAAAGHAAAMDKARQDFGAMLEKHGQHLDTLSDQLAQNTRALEMLRASSGARAA